MKKVLLAILSATLLLASACGGTESSSSAELKGAEASGVGPFTVDVWADNWFALYVNGELVGEDSVPITTERSFNKETFTFEAELPLTVEYAESAVSPKDGYDEVNWDSAAKLIWGTDLEQTNTVLLRTTTN